MRVRALLAATLVMGGAPLVAQSGGRTTSRTTSRATPRVGVLAGASIATLAGNPVEEWGRRTGVAVGATLTRPLTSVVSVQPELLFAQKGARLSEDGFAATVRLAYVEVPLLLRVDVPTTGVAVRPHLYAGPALAFRATCDVEASGGGVRASRPCRDLVAAQGDPDLHAFDAGLMLGGALGVDVGRRRLNVGARYTHGLTSLVSGDAVRNRAITVYGGVELPIGR